VYVYFFFIAIHCSISVWCAFTKANCSVEGFQRNIWSTVPEGRPFVIKCVITKRVFSTLEMKRFLSAIREKVIPNLGNIIWDWKFNYERERQQPQECFDLLEGTLRAYKKEFSEDNEAVTLIEAGLERIREVIAELGEDYSRRQPRLWEPNSSGMPSKFELLIMVHSDRRDDWWVTPD
jgi:hypothetical protein